MNSLHVFSNNDFGKVRVVMQNGEPWFVGKDAAEILRYSNTRDALLRHVDDEDRAEVGIHDGSQTRNMTVINESGIYSLVLRSELPTAIQFKRWVTSDILPSIRKTGTYSVADTPTQALLKAVQLIAEQEQKLLQIETQQTVIKHRLDAIDAVDTIGDLQQRLNAMVRKYAHQRGVLFAVAWAHFTESFNTAYHTNLKLLVNNHTQKHGIKKLTIPQYLSGADKLEDAIRVADKMLNFEKV